MKERINDCLIKAKGYARRYSTQHITRTVDNVGFDNIKSPINSGFNFEGLNVGRLFAH